MSAASSTTAAANRAKMAQNAFGMNQNTGVSRNNSVNKTSSNIKLYSKINQTNASVLKGTRGTSSTKNATGGINKSFTNGMPDRKKPKLEIKNFNIKKNLDTSALGQDNSPAQLYAQAKSSKNSKQQGIPMNVFY